MADIRLSDKQREFIEALKGVDVPVLQWPPYRSRYTIGVDLAEKNGDRSVVVTAKRHREGGVEELYINEWSGSLDFKWYRNPIKWWRCRRIAKIIGRSSPQVVMYSTPSGDNHFYEEWARFHREEK